MTKALKLVDNKYRNQFLFIMFSSLLLSAIFFKLAIDNSAFELEMYEKIFIMKYGYYNVDGYTMFKIGSNTIRYSDNLINLMSGNMSIYLFGSLFTFIMTAMVGGIEKVTKFGIFIKTNLYSWL